MRVPIIRSVLPETKFRQQKPFSCIKAGRESLQDEKSTRGAGSNSGFFQDTVQPSLAYIARAFRGQPAKICI